jgi:hypothetical protein
VVHQLSPSHWNVVALLVPGAPSQQELLAMLGTAQRVLGSSEQHAPDVSQLLLSVAVFAQLSLWFDRSDAVARFGGAEAAAQVRSVL